MPRETIGMIGVGLLGSAMAERLLQSDFAVLGFDCDEDRLGDLRSLGGSAAESAVAVVQQCRRIVLSLPDSEVVASVVETIVEHVGKGATIVDTTTGDPKSTVAVGAQLGRAGAVYIDATVAGSSQQARERRVVVMAGGDKEAFESCGDLFDCFAHRVFHVGPIGSGVKMKLVVNLALGLNRAVLAEALSLAKAAGLDQQAALDVMKAGAAYSAAMDSKGDKMVSGDFAPQARLAQHMKDVGLILELGHQNDLHLPLSESHRRLLELAIERGYADADNSAVIKAYD